MPIARSRSHSLSRRSLRVLLPIAGCCLIVIAWLVMKRFNEVLPGAGKMASEFSDLASSPGSVLSAVGNSLQRLVIGVGVAYILAFGAVALTARGGRYAKWLVAPYIVWTAATPSLVAALMGILVFGFSNLSVYSATVVVLFPYIWISLSEAFGKLDPGLREMAVVFKMRRSMYLRHVVLPELMPDLFQALRSAHGLGWKIVVLTGLMAGAGSPGIGQKYELAYSVFNISELVAWIVFFLAAVWIVEYGILQPVGRRLFRWRA